MGLFRGNAVCPKVKNCPNPVLPLVGGQGGLQPTRNLGVQLTLLQPGRADYAHQITASPPGFENPAASLQDDDEEEVNENLGDLFKKMLEVDVFNQEDNEFYENYKFYDEVSDDTGIGESSKDNSVHSEGSDGSFCIVKRLLSRNGYQVQL